MPALKSVLGLLLMGMLAIPSGYAQASEDCAYEMGRKIEDLPATLKAHKEWIENDGWKDPGISGRANLCNADLSGANLERADLRGAELKRAYLGGANLERADLHGATLEGVYLSGANLQRADLRGANLQQAYLDGAKLGRANLLQANLEQANLSEANLERASLRRANLVWVNLAKANLDRASLHRANLQGANLGGAELKGAFLREANLERADLREANLEWANLGEANLEQANLGGANLQWANLGGANLERAILDQTVLQDTKLSNADLSNAIYQPATAPAQGYLSGLYGLRSVGFCPGKHSGLVQLRKALKDAGQRELERESTFALEHWKTCYLLDRPEGKFELRNRGCWLSLDNAENSEEARETRWGGHECLPSSDSSNKAIVAPLEGALKLVFFEWTTGYGLSSGRPILILVTLIGIFALVYLAPIVITPKRSDHDGGIYRIWPEGRIKRNRARFEAADDISIERLNTGGIAAFWLAFYFSVASAFHLGWRDLNVGSWIARLQPREYALRAKGWVRVVSGVQSLISVYLIAMWVLTYFGRPFE